MDQRVPAPPLDRGFQWLNTERPLDFRRELQGHVVLLDFWTYCCINCMHVLPDLAWLEEKYADQPFVVIGVHSAKFNNEQDRRNVRSAVLRYEIAHPVVVDEEMAIWREYGTRSWPTRVLIDPEGFVVGGAPGEGFLAEFDQIIGQTLDEHRAKGSLADGPLVLRREEVIPSASPLRFPGKVTVLEDREWLAIADSNHNRIVITTLPDEHGACELVQVIGSGEPGFVDGQDDEAQFDHPQGMSAANGTLYVADTENHAIRAIGLDDWAVRTVAGTGEMSNDRQGGGSGTSQGLNSPWDVAATEQSVYIAMAGTHQLWLHHIESGLTGVVAGSGREDIIDGPAAEAALAQPSGLTFLGDALYFADSETSAIRGLDGRSGSVFTVLGRGLFEFGDIDGSYPHARLQHALGIATWNEHLLVADTYNHKLKVVDPATQSVKALAGLERSGVRDDAGALGLFEPGGLDVIGQVAYIADTNNHRVVRYDLTTDAWTEVRVHGLSRPAASGSGNVIDAGEVSVHSDQPTRIEFHPALPVGAKINIEAPVSILIKGSEDTIVLQEMIHADTLPILSEMRAVAGAETLTAELHLAYCTEEDGGLCAPHSVTWKFNTQDSSEDISQISLREPSK